MGVQKLNDATRLDSVSAETWKTTPRMQRRKEPEQSRDEMMKRRRLKPGRPSLIMGSVRSVVKHYRGANSTSQEPG